MLGILFTQFGRHASDYFKTRAIPKIITILGFLAVFAAVMIGLYVLISSGMEFIASSSFFGGAVSLYIYELILLVVVALSVGTALIEGIFSLFRNANELWILSSPGYSRIPDMVVSETLIGGAFLPLLILAIPTLCAMQHVYHIGVAGFVLGLLSTLFLVAASVILTLVGAFVIAKILSTFNALRLSTLLAILVAIVVIVGGAIWQTIGRESATILFPDYAQVTSHAAQTITVEQHFEFLPSNPAALVLYGVQERNWQVSLLGTGALLLASLFLYLVYRLVSVWYLPLWQELQAEPQPVHSRQRTNTPEKFPRYLKGAIGALFEKEWLVIFRTGRDFMWLLFMLFLWLLQIGIDVIIKRQIADISIGAFPLIIQALEVGVIAYFLGAFALRFAFPTLSTERGTAWIVNASPIPLARIYLSKLLFFCSFFGLLSIVVAVLHSVLLGLSLGTAIGLVLLSFVIALTITSFAIFLGVLFPNFETTDPQALSTSLPGIAFVLVILIYGALGSYAFLSLLASGSALEILLFSGGSLVAIVLFVALSLQRLKTFEFGVLTAS